MTQRPLIQPTDKEWRMPDLTASDVRELFDYDSTSGNLIWRARDVVSANERRWNSNYAGKPAGTRGNKGHIKVRLLGRVWLAHRLIWLYVHGAWPRDEIDHINGNPRDNRLENLRECSHAENHQNRGVAANNRSGLTGVGWYPRLGKWRADIKVNGRQRALGLFASRADAEAAYLRAKRELHTFQPTPRAA